MHDLGTQAPHEVWPAIPHRALKPRLSQPALRANKIGLDVALEALREA